MKANRNSLAKRTVKSDVAVSPVIGVILMVAITVVLAAAVYVWTNTFAGDDEGSESATLRTLSVDLDSDGRKDWIRITLLKGENAPYPMDFVDWQITRADGTVASGAGGDVLCTTAEITTGGVDYSCTNAVVAEDCDDPSVDCDEWDIGETFFFPCDASGEYRISVAVRGTALIDNRATCEGPAVAST